MLVRDGHHSHYWEVLPESQRQRSFVEHDKAHVDFYGTVLVGQYLLLTVWESDCVYQWTFIGRVLVDPS